MSEPLHVLTVLRYRREPMDAASTKGVAVAGGLLSLASVVVPKPLAISLNERMMDITALPPDANWNWAVLLWVLLWIILPWALGGVLIFLAAWLLRSGMRQAVFGERIGAGGWLFVGAAGIYLLMGVATGVTMIWYKWGALLVLPATYRLVAGRILPGVADVMIVLLHLGALLSIGDLAARVRRPWVSRVALIVLGFSGVACAVRTAYLYSPAHLFPEEYWLTVGIASLAAQLGQMVFWPMVGVVVWRARGRG